MATRPLAFLLLLELNKFYWQVTSDSLSAWLANKLGATQLMLVKSKSLIAYQEMLSIPLQKLVEDELLDSQFVEFATGQKYQTWLLNKVDYNIFEQGFKLKKLEAKGLLVNITSN